MSDSKCKIKITIKEKLAYGRVFYYPFCDVSHVLCDLLKRKTLTKNDVEFIESRGWEVVRE